MNVAPDQPSQQTLITQHSGIRENLESTAPGQLSQQRQSHLEQQRTLSTAAWLAASESREAAGMRIHSSGQCEKMGRSVEPHCKDTVACHHHSLSSDPGCETERHVSARDRTSTQEHHHPAGRMAQRQGLISHSHQDECHRDPWHCLRGVGLPIEDILDFDTSRGWRAGAGDGKEQRGDFNDASRNNRNINNSRSGQRVRLYRKRVCVRLGSLQWSLALVLVVRSRPSFATCHTPTHTHATPTPARPLTVA